jgi:GTP-binding protein
MFHDEVELKLKSGKGGDGSVSFRREKYIPRGGPDGGDGGHGGDVLIVTNRQLSDLNQYASLKELHAENGQPGSGQKMHGRDGTALAVEVPVGTRVFRKRGNDWRSVADFIQADQSKRILKGGEGGRGNVHFATSTHQTPRTAEPGEPAEEAIFRFELQLIADVGIIGLPNSGKSTFLSIVSDAKPKIGNYPFTTLSPVLGVVSWHDNRLIMADIPGLIEGASQGKGLGHTFLRHVRRTKMLVHFIDAMSPDYAHDYTVVREELRQFDPELADKPELVVITKTELNTDTEDFTTKREALAKIITPPSVFFDKKTISAVTHLHIPELIQTLFESLQPHT